MKPLPLDTLEFANKLKLACMDPKLAETQAEIFTNLLEGTVVSSDKYHYAINKRK